MKKESRILIIAEVGIAHEGCMSKARELIRQVHACGADIAKFQLYSVDALFPDKQIISQNRNWYDEVKRTELTKGQTFMLADYCKEGGVEFFASCFDLERLAWLEEIGVKRHKVASRMNKNKELIDAMLATKKEVILSTNYPPDYYSPPPDFWPYTLLYCVPEYPTPLSALKFASINFWPNSPWCGFSDHTIGIEASMIAISRGARIIEKHFTLKRDNSNPDMICSIEPKELKELVRFARICEKVL